MVAMQVYLIILSLHGMWYRKRHFKYLPLKIELAIFSPDCWVLLDWSQDIHVDNSVYASLELHGIFWARIYDSKLASEEERLRDQRLF